MKYTKIRRLFNNQSLMGRTSMILGDVAPNFFYTNHN